MRTEPDALQAHYHRPLLHHRVPIGDDKYFVSLDGRVLPRSPVLVSAPEDDDRRVSAQVGS